MTIVWYNGLDMIQTEPGARWEAILRALLTPEALQSLTKAAKDLYDSLLGRRPQGIYEVLEHHTTLELLDPRGEVAIVERLQTVRFLQDHIEAFTDHAWGDGEVFAEYTCSPGVPVDCYQDGSRHTVLISLREVKHRGDVLRFKIRRKVLRGFLTPNECWETDVYHRTQELSVTILFPRERRCRRATVTQRSTSKTVVLGPENSEFLEDGRQRLTWEIDKPRLHERYALKWEW